MMKLLRIYQSIFILRDYLKELEEHKDDLEIRSDVEYNVGESFHQKYLLLSDDDEKRECVNKFKTLFPQSNYHIDDWKEKVPDPVKMKLFFGNRLTTLHTLCSEIEKHK